MGEKRGNLVKLIYDFDTVKCCEIGRTTKDGTNWYRVTAKRFRSWDGPRRLTGPKEQPGHGVSGFQNIEMETIDYDGPVYLYETNIKKEKQGREEFIEPAQKVEIDEEVYVRRGNRL
jgi:hypothetical protein